jgi:predicted aspartyl protease
MNSKVFLIWLFFHSCFLFAQQKQDFPEARPLGFVLPDGVDKTTIPFELHNNLIVISVLLNSTLPLKFVLDTGVRITVLTEKSLTDLLNLQYTRKITIPGLGGEKLVDAYVVNNITLNIGKVRGSGHTILVLEEDLLQLKNYLGVNVHGILGYELFDRFVVDINYNKKIITFYKPTSYKKKQRFNELSIAIEDTKPYIEANFVIRNKTIEKGKFMIDTGASHTMLFDTRTADYIYVPQPYITSALGRGLGGTIFGSVARIDKLWIDKYEFKGVIATFPDPESYDTSGERNFRNGTLGGGMISRFHIIFDYSNNKIYVRKNRAFRNRFEFNLSGLIIRAKGVYLREFEIDNIRKNSAAEAAGLQVGDEILEINGVRTYKLDLDNVMGKLNDKIKKRIRLVILRDGKSMNIEFNLTRLI